MSNIKKYDSVAETTADCVAILNSHKEGNWKRKSKFNLKVSFNMGGTHIVRVFSNGKEFASLITCEEFTLLCKDVDLSEHKLIIEKVNALAKFYYTHDYENVWYDPYEKKVWVTGGDGGIFYSEEQPKVVARKVEEGTFNFEVQPPYFHEKIKELNDSTFEAEADPIDYMYDEMDFDEDEERENQNYILIGCINDIGNIECDEDEKTVSLKSKPTIAELKQKLAEAVKNEQYEKASELKKQIDKLEKE